MRTGKLAGVLCPLADWNLIYTVPRGEHGSVTLTIATTDKTACEIYASHVKQGNAGAGVSRVDSDQIMSPLTITTNTVTISSWGVGSLDDIYVYSSVADKVVASVTTEGLEYTREVLPRK
jgi:hypothetical protein